MSNLPSIDDILNANDSDEDVDTVHVDLEQLLDNDSDDDDTLGMSTVPTSIKPHMIDPITEESSNKEIADLLYALEEEASEKSDQNIDIVGHKELSKYLTDDILLPGQSRHMFSAGSPDIEPDDNKVVTLLSTLQLADRRETRLMQSGDRDGKSALQAKISAGESDMKASSGNLQLSHLKCLLMDTLSSQLSRNAQFRQHGPGTASVVQITGKFIAVGTTRGLVLLFDHSQEMRQVIGSSAPANSRNSNPVTALDVTASGDMIVCGYSNGELILWETNKGGVVKRISDLHSCAVVRLCIVYGVGDMAANITGVSNDYSIVSADTKGIVQKSRLSKVLFLTVTAESECLLDGSAGHVMDLCALPPYTAQQSLIKTQMFSSSGQVGVDRLPSALPASEQLIALNSHTRTYIIRVYPEVSILNRWAAPAAAVNPQGGTVRPGLTIALDWTWALVAEYPQVKARTLSSGPTIFPLLARGWGQTLDVYASCVRGAPKAAEGEVAVINSEAPLDFFSLGDVVLGSDIVSVRWLGTNTVTALTVKEVCVLHLPDFVVERIPLEAPVASLLASSLENKGIDEMIKLGTAVHKQRIYLLSPDKMFMFYLQSWREQVDQLVADGQWLDALAFVLDRFKKTGKKLVASAPSTGSGEEVTPADMELYIRRYAELAVIRQQAGGLGSRRGSVGGGAVAGGHHFLVAQVCIEFCVMAGGDLLSVLYDEIYRIFSAAHQQPIFIESLEPFILRRQIRDLPAKVFGDMLDYGVKAMKLAFLERCICHFDLMDIDINATVRLLLKHRLMSGFLYVYSFGLMDFAGAFQITFESMVSMPLVPGATGAMAMEYEFPFPEQADLGYKLLLFIQYTALGRVFPRGEDTVISSSCLAGLVKAVVSAAELPALPSAPRKVSSIDILSQQLDSPVIYPYLFALAKVDFYALFYCLHLAFKELYAQCAGVGLEYQQKADSELHDSFGDMVFALLEFAKNGDTVLKMQNSFQLCFFEHFLDLLVTVATPLPEVLVEDLVVYCRLHVKPHSEAERRVSSLVSAQVKICSYPGPFVNCLEKNGFFLAALKLYGIKVRSTSRTLSNALKSYVAERSEESRGQVFSYIHQFFASMTAAADGAPTDSLAEARHSESRDVLVQSVEDLAAINLLETKKVTAMYLSPTHLSAVMDKTQRQQKLQFELLDAVVRGLPAPTASSDDVDGLSNAALSGDEDALSSNEMLVYITQMATFRPQELHSFLSTHNNYPLDESLKVCRSKGIFDATAFLLERAGDSMAALDLCLKEISSALALTLKEVEVLVRAQCNETGGAMSRKPGTFRRGSRTGAGLGANSGAVDVLQILRGGHGHTARHVFDPLHAIASYRTFCDAVTLSTGVCARHDNKSSSAHWFKVLDYFLKEKYAMMGTSVSTRNSLEGISSGSAVDEFSRDIMGLVVGYALKDFMGHMSSHVPSQDIVRRITQEQMIGSRFAEFKDVMISMVESYRHEIHLYETYLRINTDDILQLRARRMKQKHRGLRHSGASPQTNRSGAEEVIHIITESAEDGEDRSSAGGAEGKVIGGRRHSLTHGSRMKPAGQGIIDRFRASQKIVHVPADGASENSANKPYRLVVSTTLPAQTPSVDLELSAARRRPGSLPAQAKFEAVYGY